MSKVTPLFALLLALSASEASACWPWCSRIFASVTAPLPEFDIVLPHPREEKLKTVKDAPRRDVEADFLIMPWNAEDLFDDAYGRLNFGISRRHAYRRWLWTIERTDRVGWGAIYEQRWGNNYIRLAVQGGISELDFGFYANSAELWREGRNLGLAQSPDTLTGMFARAVLSLGGRKRFKEVSYEFDIARTQDLPFYRNVMGDRGLTGIPNKAIVLYAADHTPAGAVLRTLMGFTADRFEVIADANGRMGRGNKFRVWFTNDAGTAIRPSLLVRSQNELRHRRFLHERQEEQKTDD